MNIQEIIVANGASLLLLIVLLICRRIAGRTRNGGERVFSWLICLVILGACLELLTFLIDGKPGGSMRVLVFLSNSLEYAVNAAASMVWVWYVDLTLYRDEKRLNKVHLPFAIGWLVLVGLLIANVFGQFLFSVDAANVYARELLGYLFYVYFFGCYIASIGVYYRFRAQRINVRFFPIWMFLGPLFVAIVLQILFYGISVTFLGTSIGLVGLALNMQSKISLVDSLTGLYNRRYIEYEMLAAKKSKRYIYSGIMFDIDRFKQINDTLGHSVGDIALREAASVLVRSTDRDSTAFRYAGDEFIILVKEAIGEEKKLEEKTIALKDRIREEAEKLNRRDTDYKIVFSMGHAIYDPELPDDEFFRRMDEEMYKEKQMHKTEEEKLSPSV